MQPQQPCLNTAPPPPVDTSEVPPPGSPSPQPLAAPTPPVGGVQLGGCDPVTPQAAPPPPPDVTADSWVVADMDTGAVLAAKDPHGRERPASTMKTLTSLLAVRELRMDDTITATAEDANQEGSRVGLQPGVTYTVRDVLTGLILNSGNDAAHALAMKMGGVPATLAKMNALAQRLGAKDTRAASPSGLDAPGMSTSSYDLALIFRAALRNPDFAAIAATKQAELPGQGGQRVQISTDNEVVRSYEGILGAKNGFTDDAQHTFVAAAERGGHRVVVALMHSQNLLNTPAEHLLDYGFQLIGAKPIGQLVSEQRPKPPAAAAARPRNVPPQPNPASGQFTAIGISLAALAVIAATAAVLLAYRRRRAALAAAARRESADHPSDPSLR